MYTCQGFPRAEPKARMKFHVHACACSVMSSSVTPWIVVHQTLLSMGFSRQEYWDGLLFQGDLPDLVHVVH